MAKYPLVIVDWDDHTSLDDWIELKDLTLTHMRVCSVGFLVKEDEKHVWLAAGIGVDDGDITSVQCILKADITARAELKVPHVTQLEPSSRSGRSKRPRRRKPLRGR